MEGLRLILNDTVTIENGLAGFSQGFLWLYFSGYTIQQAAALFFDSEMTQKIVFEYGEMSDTYEGYTECRGITIDGDNQVSVCMVRGVTENV